MSNTDRGSISLVDTEKVLLSIAAKDQGGVARAVAASDFTWDSSNTGAVALEEVVNADGTPGDPYTRWARTPAPGASVVTVTNVTTGDTETVTMQVSQSGPGEIGLSAGTPIPE